MGTELWVDRERAIWTVLPLHPQPQPHESFTSYITRLAEANGLQSINELFSLADIHRGRLIRFRTSPDYPAPSYAGFARIAGRQEECFLSMTFFHLAQHFGYSTSPNPLHRFLQGSLAAHLRYCPVCLAEYDPPYHQLFWRFLVLPGCPEHGIHLLDRCGHCGSPLPLLTRLPQLTTCSTCQGDLKTCEPSRLSDEVLQQTHARTDDLKMLLCPLQRQVNDTQAKLIGKRFQLLRQQRGLWIPEVAHLLGRDASVVHDIEQVSRFRQATLGNYIQYADLLGCSLCAVFDEQSLQELLVPVGEEQLLDQVEATIHQLKARGKPVLPGSIGDFMGMSGRRLKQYPRVKKLLSRYETERKQELLDAKREEELVKQVEYMLRQLEARGEPIVLQHVCDQVGLVYSWMVKRYPRIRALFRQYQKNRSEHRRSPRRDEEEKVQQVQTAINLLVSRGEPVTLKRIRQIVRLTQKQLRCSPAVKALLAPYTGKWQREAS